VRLEETVIAMNQRNRYDDFTRPDPAQVKHGIHLWHAYNRVLPPLLMD
jgi:hypothetical protein